MRVCAIICEFNPFHNGHKYLLEQAKLLSGCDAVICLMSGSFTQRGDICIMDKFKRARHAVLCGADCVIELPAPFSVAPAEIFASGAIKILNSIPDVTTLAFGCENAETDFLSAAELLISEPPLFKEVLNDKLADGESYIKSYTAAFEACGGQKNLLSRPNNILGIEYSKAFLKSESKIKILPIQRIGAGFGDGDLKDNYSSAGAIRNNSRHPIVKSNVPDCVYEDFEDFSVIFNRFEDFLRFKLLQSDTKTLNKIYGCSEGLENKLISLACLPFNELVEKATGRRYAASRIKRILTANLLNLYRDNCEKYLQSPLYLKPLAVKQECANEMLAALSKSEYPLLTTGIQTENLCAAARECLETDKNAHKIRAFIANQSLLPDKLYLI